MHMIVTNAAATNKTMATTERDAIKVILVLDLLSARTKTVLLFVSSS